MNILSFNAEKNYKIAYDLFYFEENLKGAKKYIELALKECRHHIKTLKLKGALLIFQEKLTAALKVLKTLEDLTQGDFEIYSKLAYCYLGMNNFKKAVEYCNKSAMYVDLDETEKMATLYKLKIDIFLQQGKKARAARLLKNAYKILKENELLNLKKNYGLLYNSEVHLVLELKEKAR